MQNEIIQRWTQLNKDAMDAIKELGEINTNAMSTLTQHQMDAVNLYMQGGAKQLETLTEAKGVQDIVATQSQTFNEFNEKLVENTRQTIEDLTKVKDQLTSWTEKTVKKATEQSA